MNETVCWHCKKTFQYNGEKYRDVNCSFCDVMNSVYNPDNYKPYVPNGTERKDEMIDYNSDKYQSKWVYLPRVGETMDFDIKEIKEVQSDNPKLNFSENVPVMIDGEQAIDDEGEPIFKKKDLGYHIECELGNGRILSVGSMSAFINVFKKHNIQDGEKVRIAHPEKGIWKVVKL